MRRHADRGAALLGQRGVVHYQHRVVATEQPIGLAGQFLQERSGVPAAGRDEVVEPIVCSEAEPLGHRLNALAIAWSDQPGHVERAHPPARPVAEPRQEGREPPLQITLHARAGALLRHDRLSKADPS